MGLLSKVKNWFSNGVKNTTSNNTRSRTTTTTTTKNNGRPVTTKQNKSDEEERKRKIKEAFASAQTKTKAEDAGKSKSTKPVDSTNKTRSSLQNYAKTSGHTGYSKLDSADRKYMQEDEKITAKNNPLAYTFAKSTANSASLGAVNTVSKLANKDEQKHQAQVKRIVGDNATEKQINRAKFAGELAGSIPMFAMGAGGARAAVAGTEAVAKTTSKLARTEAMKKLGARMIEKGAFSGTVEQAAKYYSQRLAEDLAADTIVDHTMSIVDSANRAYATDGSAEDKAKEFLKNQAFNVGISGAIDVTPAVARAIKGSGALKALKKAEADKVKGVLDNAIKRKGYDYSVPKVNLKGEPNNIKDITDESKRVIDNLPKKNSADSVSVNDLLESRKHGESTSLINEGNAINERWDSLADAKKAMSDTADNNSYTNMVDKEIKGLADKKADLNNRIANRITEIDDEIEKLNNLKALSSDEGTISSIDNQIAKLTNEANVLKNNFPKEPSYGYHAGDLGKTEYMSMQGGRGTGSYGTGTYFGGGEDVVKGHNMRDGVEAPLHRVDFNNYNLYKPKDYEDGFRLHEDLKILNNNNRLINRKAVPSENELQDLIHSAYYEGDKEAANELNELFKTIRGSRQLTLDNNYHADGFNYEDWYDNVLSPKISEFEEIAKSEGLDPNEIPEHSLGDVSIDDLLSGKIDFDAMKTPFEKRVDELKSEFEESNKPKGSKIEKGSDEIEPSDFMKYYGEHQQLLEKSLEDLRYEDEEFNEAISRLSERFGLSKEKMNEILANIDNAVNKNDYWQKRGMDSSSTMLMKGAGYDGIDVRGVDGLDNTKYGSVIYNLKDSDLPESNLPINKPVEPPVSAVKQEPPVEPIPKEEQIPFEDTTTPKTETEPPLTREEKRQATLAKKRQENANAFKKERDEVQAKIIELEKTLDNTTEFNKIRSAKKREDIKKEYEKLVKKRNDIDEELEKLKKKGAVPKDVQAQTEPIEPPKVEKPTEPTNTVPPVKETVEPTGGAKNVPPTAETTDTSGLKMDNVQVSNWGKNSYIGSTRSLGEAFDLTDVKPASVLEAENHYGVITEATPLQQIKMINLQKKLKEALDELNLRYSDASVTVHNTSYEEEYRKIVEDAAMEQARMQGLYPSDFEGMSGVHDGIANSHPLQALSGDAVNRKDTFNAVYSKRSYRQMLATAWEDVQTKPQEVMNALYNTLKEGKRFTAADLGMAVSLVRYGDTYGVTAASDLGHIFMIEYANEVGRLSGMYQFVAKQWDFLSSDKKLSVLDTQMDRLSRELGFPSLDEMLKKVDAQQANGVKGEDGKDVIQGLLDMRKEGTGAYNLHSEEEGFVNLCLDNICNSTDEEIVKKSKEMLFDALRNSVDPTILSTLTSWRYLSMLMNPRTHIRNIVGNFAFGFARGISDVFETTIQKAMKSSGVIDYQTRAFLTPQELANLHNGTGGYGEVIQKALDDDIDELMKMSEGRFSALIKGNANADASMLNKVIDKGNDFNGFLLEREDEIFVRGNYKKSFYQFLKANGYGTDHANISGVIENGHFASEEDLFEAARNFAKTDAIDATFRNHTEFSKALSRLTRAGMNRNATGLQKGVSLVTNALVPFTTTPTNILIAGVKFSPVGLIKGTSRITKALKSGDPELFLKAATDYAQGLTGTGVMLLGIYLGQHAFDEAGLSLSTSAGQDDKAKAYKRAGVQDYSLVYMREDGTGWSYSLDWCSPMAQTLFMGAEIGRNMQADNAEGNTIWDMESNIINVATKVLDPVLEMSMLQGINGFIEGAAQDDDMNGLSAGALNLARTYVGSYVPSVLGSVNKTISPYEYETVGTSSTTGGSTIDYWTNSQIAKIPILSNKVLAPKINEKGEVVGEKTSGKDYAAAALKNFVSPGNFRSINMSESDREAFKLYDELSKEGDEYAGEVFAKVDYGTDKSIGLKSKKYGLEPEKIKIDKFERADWNKDRATNGKVGLEEVLKSKAWNSYYGKDDDSRDARASEVKNLDIKSTQDALDWLIKQPEYTSADNEEKKQMRKQILDDAREYSANKTLYMNKGNTEYDYRFKVDVPAKSQAKEKEYLKAGLTRKDVVEFTDKAKKISYADDGTPHTSYSKKTMLKAFDGMNLTEEQKALLYNTYKQSNAKSYGSSGSGSGYSRGGSSKSSTKQSSASKSAFKTSVSDSDYKSIVNATSSSKRKQVAKSLGLTDAEVQAIIKQANRETLKLKG